MEGRRNKRKQTEERNETERKGMRKGDDKVRKRKGKEK